MTIREAISDEIERLRALAAENDGALGGEDLARLFGLAEDLSTYAAADDADAGSELASAPTLSVYDTVFASDMLRALQELGPYRDSLLAVPDARAALVARVDERARLVEELADEAALARARKVPT